MAKVATRKSVSANTPSNIPVNPAAAERLLTGAHLGERIKRLRLKRSMGLNELGKLTGLSASFLSQLETGRVVPTLRNLARIAIVFGKDLTYFFDSEGETVFRVQRKSDRIRLAMGEIVPSYIAESFSILVPEGGLRPCIAEFLPGPTVEPFHADRHPGVEMVYVLSGCVSLAYNGEDHLLGPGDVLYIDGEAQRSYRCDGKLPSQALIISFDEEPPSLKHSRKR